MAQSTRFTLIGLALVLVLIAAATAILLIIAKGSVRQSKIAQCASQMKARWDTYVNTAVQTGRPGGVMPPDLGPPLENCFCPLVPETSERGRTSYRGPIRNVNRIEDRDPIMADKEGNHGPGAGGNVLTKMGDVKEVGETDPLWIRARETTKD